MTKVHNSTKFLADENIPFATIRELKSYSNITVTIKGGLAHSETECERGNYRLNSLAKRIRDLQADFNTALSSTPIPSRDDKITLASLEELKQEDFELVHEPPHVCGTAPQRIVLEARKNRDRTAITYWYYWDYDLLVGDHIDWEPVSLVYSKDDELLEIYARVHDGLVRYHPMRGKAIIYFIRYGHTPTIRVANKETDVELLGNDRKNAIRKKWLDLCYRYAESDNWSKVKQPAIEFSDGPVLDPAWKAWGKHAVYLRI